MQLFPLYFKFILFSFLSFGTFTTYGYDLDDRGIVFRFTVETRSLPLQNVQTVSWDHPASIQLAPMVFTLEVTILLHLMSRTKRVALYFHQANASMACTGTTWPLPS
jgi:hypothetical protein